jgi:hypothetical protein
VARRYTGTGFQCPHCGQVSHNPNDLLHQYCSVCNKFMGDLTDDLPIKPKKDPVLWVKRWLRYDDDGDLWYLASEGKWKLVGADVGQSGCSLERLEFHYGPTTLLWWSDSQLCDAHGQSRCTYCSRNNGKFWCDECANYNLTGMHGQLCPNRIRGTRVNLP